MYQCCEKSLLYFYFHNQFVGNFSGSKFEYINVCHINYLRYFHFLSGKWKLARCTRPPVI